MAACRGHDCADQPHWGVAQCEVIIIITVSLQSHGYELDGVAVKAQVVKCARDLSYLGFMFYVLCSVSHLRSRAFGSAAGGGDRRDRGPKIMASMERRRGDIV